MSRRAPRRKGRPTVVADVVGQVLGELGLDGVARAHQIGAIWEATVGAQVAAHCRPLGLRGDVLEIQADSPVWSQQLQLRKPELLAALEQALGAEAPRELRFQVGYVRARSRGGPSGAGRSPGS
jgi:predicted nucleic acid-binding Zn ribbon protein